MMIVQMRSKILTSGFNPPTIHLRNAFHAVPVVWFNPSDQQYPGVGCCVYNPNSGGVPGNDFMVPDPTLVDQCQEQKAQIWVSNQPWDTIVTVRVMIDTTGFWLVQGSETDAYFTESILGGYDLIYDLISTGRKVF